MKFPRLPKKFPIILFLLFLFVEVCVFLLQKVVSIKAAGSGYEFYFQIITQPWIWLALGLSVIQLFLWTAILSKDDLSLLYSISSISYPITMVISTFIFNENLSWLVWLGGVLITIGAMIVGLESRPVKKTE